LPSGLDPAKIDDGGTMAQVGHGAVVEVEVEAEMAMIHEVLLPLMIIILGIGPNLRPPTPHRDLVSGQGH
jgi:hypothetical protein